MNKFVVKSLLLVAGSAYTLAVVPLTAMRAVVAAQAFGGCSVADLQLNVTIPFISVLINVILLVNTFQILDAHAAYLNATPAAKVLVEGNTDERGTQNTTSH